MYVPCVGFNAVAVIRYFLPKLPKDLIPSGWGPTRVELIQR